MLFEAYIEIKSIDLVRLDIKIRDKNIDMLRSNRIMVTSMFCAHIMYKDRLHMGLG